MHLSRLTVLLISAVLVNGGVVRASSHADLDPGFLQCHDCFFRGSPPQALSDVGLEQRCHRHLTGRPFASLFNTNCQSTVFTALHLSLNNGWGRGEQSTEAQEINVDSHVAIPALYRETSDGTPSSSPFLQWDSLTAELIRSSIIEKCSENGGEIYVQTGVGGFNECGGKPMWSALCCAASGGDGSFSFGIVKEGDVNVLSIKALEERVGVTGLFSGDCGEMRHEIEEELASILKKEMNSIETPNSDAQSEEHISKGNTQEAEAESIDEEVTSESSESALGSDMDIQEDSDEIERSESVLLYILSTIFSLLYAPFSPIVNIATNLPFQLGHVLQEDLAVLASVPVDSFTLVNNLGSGVCSGVSCVLNTLYKTGETSVCTMYACLSPLAGSLGLAFQEGFIGTGTLASDAVGIMTGTVGNAFSIIVTVLGSVWDGMVHYLWALSSEMGHQVSTVGSGIGKLSWRSGKGVGHVLNFGVSIVGGVVENTVVNVLEAFGGSSEESSQLQTPKLLTSEVVGE
ncbi:uncharacterized protein LOC130242941 [Danio aesculapii]|uniref:uncharacterized protein LOC130242941 n=1 Tax=Danio aesculapii TaxID=1142201 RepID=UPI0024C078F3|nr:uncharacterized protein LOC130242941 [Danio aesculapii]